MTGTLTNLMKEHERALVQMTFLIDAASRIYKQGFSNEDMNVIRGSVDYIAADFHNHCENEERKIYPGLKSYVSDFSLQSFKDEHRQITQSLELLKQLMPGVNENPAYGGLALELKTKAREFAHLFSNHIQKENECFYLMAKDILPQKTLTQIFKNWKQK
ncbi:MAG: hemerythrin domain-containing protein [Ignavibacteria bacterium]|jgi:hemerythrin-like domain-containing protein|nr:hemerythrin domain-containing protein [Ignavibacteria bacterium]